MQDHKLTLMLQIYLIFLFIYLIALSVFIILYSARLGADGGTVISLTKSGESEINSIICDGS